jgi:hypothetical protein
VPGQEEPGVGEAEDEEAPASSGTARVTTTRAAMEETGKASSAHPDHRCHGSAKLDQTAATWKARTAASAGQSTDEGCSSTSASAVASSEPNPSSRP